MACPGLTHGLNKKIGKREGWLVHAFVRTTTQILDNPTEEGTSVIVVCAGKRRTPCWPRALYQNKPAFIRSPFHIGRCRRFHLNPWGYSPTG